MFDEPLSNLDFKLRIQMRDELRRLQRRLGKTSIYVTHDQTEALALSDRIAVLSHGRIEQIGTPGEIYERPATAFVADFIGSSNLFKARIIEQSERGTIIETEEGLRLCCVPGVDGQRVLALVRPERIHVHINGPVSAATERNRFQARIAEITYLGEDLQLSLELEGGQKLRASLKNSGAGPRFTAAQPVEISFDPDDIHIPRG
jgi:spermidine/putrescine transport system ATP-binding protein